MPRLVTTLITSATLALAAGGAALAGDKRDTQRFDLSMIAQDEGKVALYGVNRQTGASCTLERGNAEQSDVVCDDGAMERYSTFASQYGADNLQPLEGDASFGIGTRRWGLSVKADENAEHDRADVEIRIGKSTMRVRALDNPDSDLAMIEFDNASAKDAAKFIDDLDDVSDEDRAAMKVGLGLDD